MNLEGKVALVTGGARRVGRAIVTELAAAGCDVAIHFHRSAREAEELATQWTEAGRRAVAFRADLNEPSSWAPLIENTAEHFGRLDVLVNNASMFLVKEGGSLGEFDPEVWTRMFRINVVAPAALCHHARTHLAADGGGKIINLTDIAAQRPWPERLSYCASKAALSALTQGLARAMAPDVQVNAVAPGIAAFPASYSIERRRELVRRVPLGREGTPEEVGRLVRFLVESGDYITGQVIPIDGGRSIA